MRDAAYDYLLGRLLYEIAEQMIVESPPFSDEDLAETVAAIREREVARSLLPDDHEIPLLDKTVGEYRLLGRYGGRDIHTLLEGGAP